MGCIIYFMVITDYNIIRSNLFNSTLRNCTTHGISSTHDIRMLRTINCIIHTDSNNRTTETFGIHSSYIKGRIKFCWQFFIINKIGVSDLIIPA